jgi:ferritin-like metal-binding protein YciE
MTRDTKTYIAWLNNAHAQEICMAKMYAMHAKDVSRGLNHFPDLADRLFAQSSRCKSQADRMASCIRRVSGRNPSPIKRAIGYAMGIMLGFTGDITIDKVIMNNLTDHGMIQFEVSAYQTLVAAAQTMEDKETEHVCREILKEEETFAQWMGNQAAPKGREFLIRTRAKEKSGAEAPR